jgi:hypothetical protein
MTMTKSSSEEEMRQLRAALRASQSDVQKLGKRNDELEKELRTVNRKLGGAWEQLDAIRHSTSWKLTAPVRLVKTAVRKGLGR